MCFFLNFLKISFLLLLFLFHKKNRKFCPDLFFESLSLRKNFLFWCFFSLGIFSKKKAPTITPLFPPSKFFWLKNFWRKNSSCIPFWICSLSTFSSWKQSAFPSLCQNFCVQFFFLLFLFSFFSCVFLFFLTKKRSIKMWDGLMQRMSRGRDQWQLKVHGLNSLNNVTARSSDQESFQSRKQSLMHVKRQVFLGNNKKICFSNSFRIKNNSFSKKKRALMALMAFAETETKVIKILLPLVHSTHVQVSWRWYVAPTTPTPELPNAHAHSAIEHCQGECTNGEISCCQRRHFGVFDGIGHAKPPQLGM